MDHWEMKDHIDDLKREVQRKQRIYRAANQMVEDYDYIMECKNAERRHKVEAYCHLLEASKMGGPMKTAREGLENIKAVL